MALKGVRNRYEKKNGFGNLNVIAGNAWGFDDRMRGSGKPNSERERNG